MNDPHVASLHYRIEHSERVNYDKAEPLEYDNPRFHVSVKSKLATVDLKEHHATEREAREVVESFLRNWEVDAGLRDGIGTINFTFDRAQIVDRKPGPGVVVVAGAGSFKVRGGDAKLTVGRSKYPPPPTLFSINPDVDDMFRRYRLFCEGKCLLGDMANFCRTVLEASARGGQSSAAAAKYGIARDVLDTLRTLVSERGGVEARKHEGRHTEFSRTEREWVLAVVKALIRRVAEVAYEASANQKQITMADFPPVK
jgi:hypothetical protein